MDDAVWPLVNWRYRPDPLHTYRVLIARCHGELIAFVIVCPTPGVLTIVGFFENELREDAMILLATVAGCFQEVQQFVEAWPAQGKN